jgi:hypothetical protein
MALEEGRIRHHVGELEPRLDLRFRRMLWQVDDRGGLYPSRERRVARSAQPSAELLLEESLTFHLLEAGECLQLGEAFGRRRLLGPKQHAQHGAPALERAHLKIERPQMELGHAPQSDGAAQEFRDRVEVEIQGA